MTLTPRIYPKPVVPPPISGASFARSTTTGFPEISAPRTWLRLIQQIENYHQQLMTFTEPDILEFLFGNSKPITDFQE